MSSDESELESADGEEIELDVPDLEAPDFDPYRFCNNIVLNKGRLKKVVKFSSKEGVQDWLICH